MTDVQALIDGSVQEWSDTKSAQRDNSMFSVSDAGLCYRSRFLKRQGVAPTRVTPVGALRKMLAGEAGHEKLQEVLSASGALLSSEVPVQAGRGILGHYDAVVAAPDGAQVLLEFKTIEKFQMAHIKKDGPKNPHILQMFTYWHLLKRSNANPELGQASLIYLMREDFQAISFDYLWDPEVSKRIKNEWAPLLAFWDHQDLPPCTCGSDYGGKGVSYCRYQTSPDTCCDEALFVRRTA